MKNTAIALILSAASLTSLFGQRTFHDVREYGASGSGKTLDTKSIQTAIDRCSAAGGVVLVPPGTYLTGSIQLRSNVELHLEKGALILGSTNLFDYEVHIPPIRSYNNVFLKHSLVYAEGLSNVAITGEGIIDGQGGSFKVLTNEKPAKYMNRPYLLRFVQCTNVRVEGVTMRNSAMWMQHYFACTDLRIRGITVLNHANKNNDMMDIDGCRNVIVSDCIGDTDDDGITLKSTGAEITENVTISNCIVSSHCNAIKTGTESTGGFRNIAITNVVVKPSRVETTMSGKRDGICGIALTLVDGGIMEGVTISNVAIEGPEVPIFIRLGNRARKHWEGAPVPGIGAIRNVAISNVQAYNVKSTGCSITGLPGHPVEGVTLRNVRVVFAGGGQPKSLDAIEELADQYPEATMWKALPAYGFFIRHATDVTMEGVDLRCEHEDLRPAVVMSDAQLVRVAQFSAPVSASAEAAFVLEATKGFMFSGSTITTKTTSLLRLKGEGNEGLWVSGNDLRNVRMLCSPDSRRSDRVIESANGWGRSN